MYSYCFYKWTTTHQSHRRHHPIHHLSPNHYRHGQMRPRWEWCLTLSHCIDWPTPPSCVWEWASAAGDKSRRPPTQFHNKIQSHRWKRGDWPLKQSFKKDACAEDIAGAMVIWTAHVNAPNSLCANSLQTWGLWMDMHAKQTYPHTYRRAGRPRYDPKRPVGQDPSPEETGWLHTGKCSYAIFLRARAPVHYTRILLTW